MTTVHFTNETVEFSENLVQNLVQFVVIKSNQDDTYNKLNWWTSKIFIKIYSKYVYTHLSYSLIINLVKVPKLRNAKNRPASKVKRTEGYTLEYPLCYVKNNVRDTYKARILCSQSTGNAILLVRENFLFNLPPCKTTWNTSMISLTHTKIIANQSKGLIVARNHETTIKILYERTIWFNVICVTTGVTPRINNKKTWKPYP